MPLNGSGVKSVGSAALGIADTISGFSAALSTVFSLLSVRDTNYVVCVTRELQLEVCL